VQILDVSALEPPGPLERILDALTDLPQGQALCVRHRREPFPLYDLLRRMGYRWRSRGEEGRFEILIWATTAEADRSLGQEPSWPC
jgi:hypothetical protein